MRNLRTIDVYSCISRAIVISQRSNFVGCVLMDGKYELHECHSTKELLEVLNAGEKIFSVLYGTMHFLIQDDALKTWARHQIEITNCLLRLN